VPQRRQHFDSVLRQSLPGIRGQVSSDVAARSSSRMRSCVGVGSDDGTETDAGDVAAAAAADDDDDAVDAAVRIANGGSPVEDRRPPSDSPTAKSADRTCS